MFAIIKRHRAAGDISAIILHHLNQFYSSPESMRCTLSSLRPYYTYSNKKIACRSSPHIKTKILYELRSLEFRSEKQSDSPIRLDFKLEKNIYKITYWGNGRWHFGYPAF